MVSKAVCHCWPDNGFLALNGTRSVAVSYALGQVIQIDSSITAFVFTGLPRCHSSLRKGDICLQVLQHMHRASFLTAQRS
jgi:hypothetical protein